MEVKSPPKTHRGETTRRAILNAAEKVIGAAGYADASISQITRDAGVAQGTFYIYFNSKEGIFRELVRELGRRVRHVLSAATAEAQNRIEAERLGLKAFIGFVAEHPDIYRIVQEALFVDTAVYRAYFQDFAESYRHGLAAAAEAGEIRDGDADVRAWALMGIAKSLGERYAAWDDSRSIDDVVDAAHDLIVRGLQA